MHQKLFADMREALLAEFGAQAVYALLAARTADPELAEVLGGFHLEEQDQVRRLGELMVALGARPRRGSARRRIAARLLVGSSRLFGERFVLRVCQDAEETVSRWYRDYALHLVRIGEIEAARECEQLSRIKGRHASTLRTWVEHLPARR